MARDSRQKPRREIAKGNFAINHRRAKPAETKPMSEKRPQAIIPIDQDNNDQTTLPA
jgi:hypothetical protein